MKIGIIGSRGFPYVYSGYETFVAQLSLRLVQRGHNVTVYCHRGLFPDRPSVVNGVNLVYLPAIERKVLSQFSHSLLSTLHALLRRFDVLLYVNSANGPFGLVTSPLGIRTAINVDGLEWLRPKWRGLGSRYFRMSSWLSTKLFDAVITDSERMADIYQREFHSASTVIEYGAEKATSVQPDLIHRLGLQEREYFLIVGRLIPDNNVHLLVDGFLQSRSRRRLVVLGDVPYADTYADEVRRRKDERLLFPGYVRDPDTLRELYCNCYAYLHGHEFGGTNPALLKALACGCCVAALDTVFSKEVLSDGKYGVFFQKDSPSIAKTIEMLEQSPAKASQLRALAPRRIDERYTWERITDEYEKLFRRIAGHEK